MVGCRKFWTDEIYLDLHVRIKVGQFFIIIGFDKYPFFDFCARPHYNEIQSLVLIKANESNEPNQRHWKAQAVELMGLDCDLVCSRFGCILESFGNIPFPAWVQSRQQLSKLRMPSWRIQKCDRIIPPEGSYRFVILQIILINHSCSYILIRFNSRSCCFPAHLFVTRPILFLAFAPTIIYSLASRALRFTWFRTDAAWLLRWLHF